MDKNFLLKNFDEKLIEIEYIYVVALSGGKDSMALLNQMLYLKKIKNFDLRAIHINHNIRGEEALRDEQFALKVCKENHIPLCICNVDCPSYSKTHHKTIEEAARILRYKKFDEYIKQLEKEYNKDGRVRLVVAHHRNDRVETIIHNILRGSGIRGLIGIEETRDYIFRPMLDVDKKDIDEYIKENNIEYVEDSTNNDINYTRNYIRKEIFPILEKVNDNYIEHIGQLGNVAKEVNDYFENLSKKIFDSIVVRFEEDKNELVINNSLFNTNDHITKIYLLLHILDVIKISKKDITKIHLEDIIKLSQKEKGGHIDLPYNLTIDKKKKNLHFKINDENYSMSKRKNKGEKLCQNIILKKSYLQKQ